MYTALDTTTNQVISIDNHTNQTVICKGCGTPMITKKGDIKAHHFAHQAKTTKCDSRNQMSDWHKAWQDKFPLHQREVRIANDKGAFKIADVLIGKTVIEFQHSPISFKEIKERTDFYKQLGYRVAWVFHSELNLNITERGFIANKLVRQPVLLAIECYKTEVKFFVDDENIVLDIHLKDKHVSKRTEHFFWGSLLTYPKFQEYLEQSKPFEWYDENEFKVELPYYLFYVASYIPAHPFFNINYKQLNEFMQKFLTSIQDRNYALSAKQIAIVERAIEWATEQYTDLGIEYLKQLTKGLTPTDAADQAMIALDLTPAHIYEPNGAYTREVLLKKYNQQQYEKDMFYAKRGNELRRIYSIYKEAVQVNLNPRSYRGLYRSIHVVDAKPLKTFTYKEVEFTYYEVTIDNHIADATDPVRTFQTILPSIARFETLTDATFVEYHHEPYRAIFRKYLVDDEKLKATMKL